MGFKLNLRNLGAIAAAPFTFGASLALAEDTNGNTGLDYITGAASAKKANKQNMALQRETNQLSIELANTAHQREVADLEAAGLNPILSAGGQGATTPTLGTAQVQNTMPGGLATSAMQIGQAAQAFGQARQAFTQAGLNKTQAEIQPELAQSEIQKNQAEATLALIQAGNQGTKTTAMKNAENLANSWWGRNVSPVLADIGQLFGGAGSAGIQAATSARNANTMANAIKSTPHTHVHYH